MAEGEVENHEAEKTKEGGASSSAKGELDCGVCGCSASFLFCRGNISRNFRFIQNNNSDTERLVRKRKRTGNVCVLSGGRYTITGGNSK